MDLSEINKIKRRKNTFRKTILSFNQEGNIAKQQQQQNNKESEYDFLSKKIDSITKSCTKYYFNKILKKLAQKSSENANIICDYIIAEETELNIKNSTKESRIKVIVWLSNFFDNQKSLKQMTKQDILLYLNSLRRPTSEDPSQRWVGSYNNRQIILNKFFRWLYNQDEPDHKKRNKPDVSSNDGDNDNGEEEDLTNLPLPQLGSLEPSTREEWQKFKDVVFP